MKRLEDIDVKGKKVLVRVDYNVPIKDGVIMDDTRIKESLRTLNYLIDHDARIILFSHMGKVKEENDKESNSLKPVAERLTEWLGKEIYFYHKTRGDSLEKIINSLKEKDVLLVENTRFEDVPDKLESSCDEELSKYWASLGDIFVFDAFGSAHRAHASTYGIGKYLPSVVGYLIEKEINVLNEIIDNENKTLLLGGAKVEDKIGIVENLIEKTDNVLIGGAMCFTFLKALGYNVGQSFVDEERIEYCKTLLEKYKDKIILPVDFICKNDIVNLNDFKDDSIGYDIGPKTIKLFEEKLSDGSLVVWNGPMGLFEETKYENGTRELLHYLYNNKIKTVIAGGDTGNAANKFKLDFYHISTGGGATLEYLSGKKFETLTNME